jgi:ABC-type spermidine/putrescine transport system permease subunit II
MRPTKTALVLLLPAGGIFLALFIAPMATLLQESFRLYVPGRVGSTADAPITFANYAELIGPSFLLFLWETYRISLFATAIGLIIAYPIAYRIARSPSALVRTWSIGLLVTLMFLAALVRLYSLELTLGSVGPISDLLSFIGVIPNSRAFIEFLVTAGLLQFIIPISVLTLLGTLQNLDPSLVDAAQAMGAATWKAHLSITLPLSIPGLLSAFLISFTYSISAFVIPLILGKGRVLFLSNLIYDRFSMVANYPSGAAISIVTLIIALIAIFIISRATSTLLSTRVSTADASLPREALAYPESIAKQQNEAKAISEIWRHQQPKSGLRQPNQVVGRTIDDLLGYLTSVVIGVTLLFLIIPLCVTVLMAFDARTYLGPLPPRAFSLHWFSRFFSDPYFIDALHTTALLAGLAVSISVLVGVLAAIFIDRYDFGGKEALIAFLVSPLVVPPVVIGFALLLFLSQIGIFDGFLRLLCGHVILTLPYTIRATVAGLVGIDRSLTEAALSLGATELQAFWEITFPLARTGIIAGAIFALAVSIDDVSVSIFLTDPTTYTLPVALVSSMRAQFDLRIAAASLLLMCFTVCLILILDRVVGLGRIIGGGIYTAHR